jgi:hypothetical protein
MSLRKLTLENICGGGLPELFQRELSEVMQNIVDVNTDAEKPRRITITVDFAPGPDRANCAIKLGINSKISPILKMAGSLYISSQGSKVEAYTSDIRQKDIFEQDEQGESAEPASQKGVFVIKRSPPSEAAAQ